MPDLRFTVSQTYLGSLLTSRLLALGAESEPTGPGNSILKSPSSSLIQLLIDLSAAARVPKSTRTGVLFTLNK